MEIVGAMAMSFMLFSPSVRSACRSCERVGFDVRLLRLMRERKRATHACSACIPWRDLAAPGAQRRRLRAPVLRGQTSAAFRVQAATPEYWPRKILSFAALALAKAERISCARLGDSSTVLLVKIARTVAKSGGDRARFRIETASITLASFGRVGTSS